MESGDQWQSALIPACDTEGRPALAVVLKRTYSYAPGQVTLCPRQEPIVEYDTYTDDSSPLYAEVLAESDLVPCKPFTDVVVSGEACAPAGRSAYYLDCEVRVGPLAKCVRVYGQRRIRRRALGGLLFTDPEPFAHKPLGYRYAFGGVARDRDGTLYAYPPNPIGCGLAFRGAGEDPAEIRVPSQENPSAPLDPEQLFLREFGEWPDAPEPVSLGWTRRNFYPRYTWAGVLPEHLQAAAKNRETLAAGQSTSAAGTTVPRMDMRFYQGASPGLWGGPLSGAEPVRLTFLDPHYPTLEFSLPGEQPRVQLTIAGQARELTAVLQTVVITTATRTLALVWRATCAVDSYEDMAQVTGLVIEKRHRTLWENRRREFWT